MNLRQPSMALAGLLLAVFAVEAVIAQEPSTATKAEVRPVLRDDRDAPIPARYASYFRGAAAAEKIRNGRSRCLNYPPLPDNTWPDGSEQAECHFRYLDPLSQDAIRDLIRARDYDRLDAILEDYRAQEATDPLKRGLLQRAFMRFEHARMRRAALDWATARPDSAYARTAAAFHYMYAGGAARGTKSARDTTEEQFAGLRNNARLAVIALREAEKLDPGLYAIYNKMIHVGRTASLGELEAYGWTKGRESETVDFHLYHELMYSLWPRWGGSYEQLDWLVAEARKQVRQAPKLAATIASASSHRGRELAQDKHHDEAMAILDRSARLGPGAQALEWAARTAEAKGELWKAAVYYSQHNRFFPNDPVVLRRFVGVLFKLAMEEWLLDVLENGLKLYPDDPYLLASLPTVHNKLGNFPQAIAGYQAVIDGGEPLKNNRQMSFYQMARLQVRDVGKPRDGIATLTRMTAEYPDDPRAWILLGEAYGQVGEQEKMRAALRRYLEVGKPRNQMDEDTMRRVREFLATQPDPPAG